MAGPPWAGHVQGASRHFLARPGLARDQHCAAARANQPNGFGNDLHGGAFADQQVPPGLRGGKGSAARPLPTELFLNGPFQRFPQRIEAITKAVAVIGAGVNQTRSFCGGHFNIVEDDREKRIDGMQRFQEVDAVSIGDKSVNKSTIESCLRGGEAGLCGSGCCGYAEIGKNLKPLILGRKAVYFG